MAHELVHAYDSCRVEVRTVLHSSSLNFLFLALVFTYSISLPYGCYCVSQMIIQFNWLLP